MGGGISSLRRLRDQCAVVRNIDDDINLQYLDFKEIIEIKLPNCLACWKRILTIEILRSELGENRTSFLSVVDSNLKSMDKSGFITSMLERGHSKHGKKLILIMIRFVFGMKAKSKSLVVKRLRRLGREHARLGITDEHMRLFVLILLRSITESLNLPDISPIINDWSVLLSFVIREMYSEGYCFVRGSNKRETDVTDYVSPSSKSSLGPSSATSSSSSHFSIGDSGVESPLYANENDSNVVVGEVFDCIERDLIQCSK